jgi:hypothetical protein
MSIEVGNEHMIANTGDVWQKGTARCGRFLALLIDCFHQDDEDGQALL